MKKLLSIAVLVLSISFCQAGPDQNWLQAAQGMITRGDTVKTPSRDRVTLLVQWARSNRVAITLTQTPGAYSITQTSRN